MIKLFPISGVRSLQVFQLFRFASFFIVGIYFAKSSLTLNDIGIYETLMLLAGAVSYFWVSGILNSYLATFPKLSQKDKVSSHANIFLVLILISFGIVILLFLMQEQVTNALTADGDLSLYRLILIYILFNNPSYISEHILLLKEKFNSILLYGAFSFIANILALILPIFLNFGLEYSIFCLGIISIIRFLIASVIVSSYSSFKINKILVYKLLSTSSPLIVSFVITGSAQYIDGYLVSKFFGQTELAIFRYGARELPFSLLLANALSIAMIPQLSLKHNLPSALKKLKTETIKLAYFLFPISILLILSSKWFFPILFNENFAYSAIIFNVYLLLVSSRLLFPQSLLMALEKNKIILYISIIELFINIIVSVYLMMKIGIIGIAYGTVIAFLIDKALLIYIVKKDLGIDSSQYIPWKIIGIFTSLLILTFVMSIR